MHSFHRRLVRRLPGLLAAGAILLFQHPAAAQVPQGQLPSPEQAREMLRTQPGLVEQLRQRVAQSGLTPDQIRARLRAAGYPESLLDEYLPGADSLALTRPGPQTFGAVRALGLISGAEADSLAMQDSLLLMSDSLRARLDSVSALRADSARADSLADSLRVLTGGGLKLFGVETFRRASTRFQPAQAGPVDENYRLGPGDVLVLILTGQVEQAHTLEVTREGFVVIPQVGQLHVANLTMGQLQDQLYSRLGRVYSGVRRGQGATTRFQVSLAKLRNVQVFVVGDVVRPGAYQISAAGTVLTALYAAGGPTENGSFRQVLVRRGDETLDSLDLYDYLLRGVNRTDLRLQSGDVVFVPVHGGFVRVTGKVSRSAIYELRPAETLRDLIAFAGGFDPTAYQTRVQIHRILPPEARGTPGRARVVVDVGPEQFAGGTVPAVPMEAGDSVTVFSVAERVRSFVTVRGNVWVEGRVGFTPGMRLSDAIRLAGGPKPDVYLDRILVARVEEDSTMVQLRSAFADSTGRVSNDLVLQDQDEIRIFARSSFRELPYVTIVGAVRRPGRVQYRQGMTLRDAVLLGEGVTADADLREAEIARIDRSRGPGSLAQTVRVPLDSGYRFGGGAPGGSRGEDADPAGGAGPGGSAAAEVPLQPYDNVLIMRLGGWDLQRLVYLTGQVQRPGRYALRSKTERLTDLLERAGGLTEEAYPGGIQFYRAFVPGRRTTDGRLPPPIGAPGDRWSDTLPLGFAERVGIDLPRVLGDPSFRDNIILVGGDSVNIPEYNPIVMVEGGVNSPGAVAYTPGKSLDWYVDAAGGYAQNGDRRRAYVTQPDGRREGVKRRVVLADGVPEPRPGAVVFVPNRAGQEQPSNMPQVLSAVATLVASLVTLVAVANR